MLDLFFRRYVPGFRVSPQAGMPGFNLDDNSLPQDASGWSDGMLPELVTPRYPDAAQTQMPPAISFPTAGPEGLVQSAPPIGLAGFRVSPQDDVPGFNVRPRDDVPGFNLDENGIQRQETTWVDGMRPGSAAPQYPDAAQTPTPAAGGEEPAQPAPPRLPEWLYQLATTPLPRLSTAFDPRSGRRIVPYEPLINPAGSYQTADQNVPTAGDARPFVGAINSLPDPGSEAPSTEQWPSADAPEQPPDINTRSGVATTQSTIPGPAAQEAIWQPIGITPPLPVKPAADPNFIPANGADDAEQQAQQQMPLLQYQQTQRRMPSTPFGTGLASGLPKVDLPEPSIKMTGLEPTSDQEFSQLIEAYRRLKEAEGRQPVSDQRSPPSLNENGVSSYASSASDSPSPGQRLLQSSVETIVPGAHYQRLARQQLGAGNYVGAAVYQAAALADAVLGAATFGQSTRLVAAGRTAAAEGGALFRRAFDSRSQLLRYLGRAPEGMQWHHIVEQSQAAQFGQRPIQSVENIVAIPTEAHQKLNAFYSSKLPISEPNTIREWLRGQSFEAQYEFGMEQLGRVLGH